MATAEQYVSEAIDAAANLYNQAQSARGDDVTVTDDLIEMLGKIANGLRLAQGLIREQVNPASGFDPLTDWDK